MQYVWVTGRIPKGLPRFCAFCLEPIGETGYLREQDTRILYCGPVCYSSHVTLTTAYLEAQKTHEDLARLVS